jgi:predicted glycoside hydrolase/deacetylase ChbG (UPF0249 family)
MNSHRHPVNARTFTVGIDDFGLHEGINAAALELARAGRATAISCLVGAPSWRHGVSRLREVDPRAVDVGLHLDLTEFPLHAPRRGLPWLIAAALSRQLDELALRDEVRRQLDAFEYALGRAPSHVDGHQHVHQLPQVREVLVAALVERHGFPPWLRDTRRPAGEVRPKPWLIEQLGASGLRRLARAAGLAQNAHLLGVYAFSASPAAYEAHLVRWLREARPGDLLMCHASAACDAPDPIIAARRNEHRTLSSAWFTEQLAKEGLTIARLG